MASITFNDGTSATLDNGTTGIASGYGSRFADWVPFTRPVGPAVTALGTGLRYQYAFRTDYGASFSMTDIPNTSMSVMLRLQAHLIGGGTCTVTVDDGPNGPYTCCLAPDGDVSISLQDKGLLLYSMSFTLINAAASPTAMLCQY